MTLALSIAFLLATYLFLTLLLSINRIEENKPMTKVIASQALDIIDLQVIYKTLELQVELNKRMITLHEKLDDKQKITEIKTVNKATKDTLRKIKALIKEAGVKI